MDLADDPVLLLGRPMKDPDVLAWLARIDPRPKFTSDGASYDWSSPKHGIDVQAHRDSKVITTVFLSSGPKGRYAGALPAGLAWTLTRDEVRGRLAAPPAFTGPAHDTWDTESHRLVVRYGPDGHPVRVSVTTAF